MQSRILLVLCLIFLMGANSAQSASFPLQATYLIDSSWSAGYQATVTITNNTATPTTSWTATFTLPQGQSITSFWNGVYTASGQTITVKNPTWSGGGVIQPGASTTFGMIVKKTATGIPALNNLLAAANGSPTPPPIPVAPVLNSIVLNPNSANSYTVSWNSVANAATYTLQQDTTSSFSNPQIVANGTSLSRTFNNQPNGAYYYRVSATNQSGTSPYSNVEAIVINAPTQLATPILQPINNSNGSSQYLVAWTSVANAAGYTVQESTQSDFSNPHTIYQGSSTSYQVTGKSPGTYFYQVTAYAGNVTSTPSNIEGTIVTQTPPTNLPVIEGYWESWNSRDSVSTIVNMHANVIDISFANFVSTGTHTYQIGGVESDQATIAQLVSLAHSLGKKVKIAVGGATYHLSDKLTTTQDAVGMAQAIATYVQQNSLDGVDFDIEDYPAPELQVALIQNTRQLLGNNALISYTPGTPAATTYPFNQVIQGAHPYLTDISFMAYDYGVNSGYNYQQDVIGLKNMGVPASKIIIGLMPGYDDLHVMTSVNDIITAAQYVISQGLGGIMFWDLNRDHENLTGLGVDAATNAAWNVFSGSTNTNSIQASDPIMEIGI